MDKLDLTGTTVVLTGAGSGIGAALARVLAQRGAHLALVDLDDAGLEETVRGLPTSCRVSRHVMDVADPVAIDALPAAVEAAHGAPADILINNAGVALSGSFADVAARDFDWLMAINLHGPIRLTRAFLPILLLRPGAQIVNISSIFGIIAPPGQTAYCAAKFGLRGFSESLRHELAPRGIGVTVVHPGGVRTSIARNARITGPDNPEQAEERAKQMEKLLVMPPERAAGIIADGIERRARRVLVGNDARMMDIVQRLMPARYWSVVQKLLGG